MTTIDTSHVTPVKKLFHNEWFDVYPMFLPLEKITFWKGNNRTIFTFDVLCREEGETLEKLSIEKITTFIAEQKIHKLPVLAESIRRNGVQVPLIIRDDMKLLDGNRRFFACHWLRMQCAEEGVDEPTFLSEIPVFVIKSSDINHEQELKILAEENFIPNLKVPWSLDAQARAIQEFYNSVLKEKKLTKDEAIYEVVSIFGITRARAIDLLDSLKISEEFINDGKGEADSIRRRGIVQDKFVYFWEFRNKAIKGNSAYKNDLIKLKDVKELFFQFMAMGIDSPIKNVKQIEPLVQSRRYDAAWKMLKDSNGADLNVVVNMVNEKKEIRKAESKIRLFYDWLEETNDLNVVAKSLLKKLGKLAHVKGEG